MVAFCARHGFIIMWRCLWIRGSYFSNLAGGTVEHIGTSIRAELPPKIVLPTDTLKIMCPFECTCEKHHDQKHVGIDIAPQNLIQKGTRFTRLQKGKYM